MKISDLQVQTSVTSHVIYCVSTGVDQEVVQFELERILHEAADYAPNVLTNPKVHVRLQTVLIPKQKTVKGRRLSTSATMAKKGWHIEVATEGKEELKELVDAAKERDWFKKIWGRRCLVSEVLTFESSKIEAERSKKVLLHHVNHQFNMKVSLVENMTDIGKSFQIKGPGGKEIITTGREILMVLLTFDNGNPMVAEVHQVGTGDPVYLVHFNNDIAERMVGSLSKHAGGFMLNRMKDKKYNATAIKQVMKELLPTQQIAEAKNCLWDPETKTITTKEEQEEKEYEEQLQQTEGFVDLASELMEFETQTKSSKAKVAGDLLFNLNDDQSIKTIHPANDDKYKNDDNIYKTTNRSTPHVHEGSSRPQRGKAQGGPVSDADSDSEHGSTGAG